MTEKEKWWRRGDPKFTWDDTIACIGQDFSDGKEHWAQEVIERSTVMRYLETWEIGCSIYWDEEVAKKVGYKGQVAPLTSIKQTFTARGFWRPGDPGRFPSPDVNYYLGTTSPGAPSPDEEEAGRRQVPMPPTTDALATDVTIEYFEPACVGDRLATRGGRLVQVRPRQTRIGFGAFTNTESEVVNQRGELVATVNGGGFSYNPGTEGPK